MLSFGLWVSIGCLHDTGEAEGQAILLIRLHGLGGLGARHLGPVQPLCSNTTTGLGSATAAFNRPLRSAPQAG